MPNRLSSLENICSMYCQVADLGDKHSNLQSNLKLPACFKHLYILYLLLRYVLN